jgi:ribokinase
MEKLAKVPVLKLGMDGCQVAGRHIQAPQVEEVDATGAGDALAAAFCVSYLDGATPIDAAERAVVIASGAVTRAGARPA